MSTSHETRITRDIFPFRIYTLRRPGVFSFSCTSSISQALCLRFHLYAFSQVSNFTLTLILTCRLKFLPRNLRLWFSRASQQIRRGSSVAFYVNCHSSILSLSQFVSLMQTVRSCSAHTRDLVPIPTLNLGLHARPLLSSDGAQVLCTLDRSFVKRDTREID